MFHAQHSRRGNMHYGRHRTFRPSPDVLEGRVLLYAATGGSWIFPDRVTYSVVADGTSIGGISSNLRQKLSTYANWELQIQKAAAVWEAVAGINLVQVPDDGSPIGSGGYQQGDPHSGDIRIGGMPQPGNQLAFAYAPQPYNGGAIAGDIFFNTEQWWQTNATTYDVMTVAVHEFGHALGMGHSEIAAAAMYAGYNSAKQSSTSDDATGLLSIYGSRQSDHFDASASNNSPSGATNLNQYFDGSGRISLADLDISSGGDVDWYRVMAPVSGPMTIRMQSSRLSSLIPKITVYKENFQTVEIATGVTHGDTVTVALPHAYPTQTWYIKAVGVSGSSGIGTYGLQVGVGPGSQAAFEPPYTAVASQPDQNPSSSPMGRGWLIDGEFIPYLGLLSLDVLDSLGGLVGGLIDGVGDGLYKIKYGTLSGFGSAELIDPDAPPIRAPGDGKTPLTVTRAALYPGARLNGDPNGLAATSPAEERRGAGWQFARRSRRREQTKASRLLAVDAARARLSLRRLVMSDPAVASSSLTHIGALPRGHLTIDHHLSTSPS